MSSSQPLPGRVEALEAAILAMGKGVQEFGDVAGHAFHGNQWIAGLGDQELRDHATAVLAELNKREAAAKAAPAVMPVAEAKVPGYNAPKGGPLTDHLVKGAREADIVKAGREKGLLGEKSYRQTESRYGSQTNPAAVLPTQTKIHLARPEENDYPSYDGKYTVVQSNETGHLRALGGDVSDWKLGDTVHLQHDQTGGRIGGYSGHEVVGIVHGDGTAEGVIPDRKIAYSVFK